MRPNFTREGWVAGHLGQCPKFDQIFFLMASLTSTRWIAETMCNRLPLLIYTCTISNPQINSKLLTIWQPFIKFVNPRIKTNLNLHLQTIHIQYFLVFPFK